MKRADYLTTAETARILGVSRVAVFQKIKGGKIKAEKFGRNYLIARKDILEASGNVLSKQRRRELEAGVDKVVAEYGEVLRRLGKE